MVRLGILGRALIAVLLLWMIAGTAFFASRQYNEANDRAWRFYNDCIADGLRASFCGNQRDIILTAHTDHLDGGLVGYAAVNAGIYLAMGLLGFLVLYGALKWVLAGADPKAKSP